jgi:ABC-type multidrug transport system fused ATPase/permease subunit
MAPQIVSVSTITAYALFLRENINASSIFTALSLFRMLQDPLRSLPNFITQIYQATSSLERLQVILLLNNIL